MIGVKLNYANARKAMNRKILFHKITAFVIFFYFFAHGTAISGAIDGPNRGYISNDNGDKCWYNKTIKEKNTYFHNSIPGTNAILTFEDPHCMSDKGLGLDINKTMINKTITFWYSHSDADFKSNLSDLYDSSLFQIKGKCMQSNKYPDIGVTIDYFIINNSITGFIHGPSLQGCK